MSSIPVSSCMTDTSRFHCSGVGSRGKERHLLGRKSFRKPGQEAQQAVALAQTRPRECSDGHGVVRSADDRSRPYYDLLCSKLSPCSQTSNAGLYIGLSSALRRHKRCDKTCIRDQHPSYSGGDPILVEVVRPVPTRRTHFKSG